MNALLCGLFRRAPTFGMTQAGEHSALTAQCLEVVKLKSENSENYTAPCTDGLGQLGVYLGSCARI